MKTLFTLLCCALVCDYAAAQDRNVNVSFEVDGKPSSYIEASVRFISDKDTLNVKIKDGNLSIPEPIFKKKATVIFYINNYVLRFASIPVTVNSLSPKWTVGVDANPFDKKKLWMIKSWKKVQVVYYLHNDDGRTFTVSDYKPSQIAKK